RIDSNSIFGASNPPVNSFGNPVANSSGGPPSATPPNASQAAQNFPQFPPTMIPSTPPSSTGDPKKDEKARKKEAKEQMKEAQQQQREILEQMMRGSKKGQKGQPQMQIGGMDMAQMQKIGEQAQKAMESGDLGKAAEMMMRVTGNIAPGILGATSLAQQGVS